MLLDDAPIQGPGPDRGVIFQEYGVFPWLTVRGNIEFGLRLAAARVSGAQRTEIVDRYMALMGLWRTSPTTIRSTFPAACASAWPWPAPTR